MLISRPVTGGSTRSLPTRLVNLVHLRFSSSTSGASASSIATSFLSRFQSLGPQTRTQTLDGNQLRLLSLTLNRPSLFSTTPPLSQLATTTPNTCEAEIANGTPLPAGYHFVYFTPAFLENELGADGTDTSYNPAHPFTRRMWAGGEVCWPRDRDGRVNPLRVGERVTETTRVLSADAKVVKKTGEEMIVVGVEKEFRNEIGIAVIDRRNWVFRKALPSPSTNQTPNLPTPTSPSSIPATSTTTSSIDGLTHTRTFRQTAVTIFRFSALTFNPHKIHYSQPWCRQVEGHKDIVVHGPLNLIAILDFWRDLRNSAAGADADANVFLPDKISYRATSPLYAEDEYRIVLKKGEGEDRKKSAVEIITPEGNVGMKAEVVGV
ncbi:hypothetical protein BDW66DRAFT_96545 [Aspergillus desertorum]